EGRVTSARQRPAEPTCADRGERAAAGTAGRNWLGPQRTGERILPMFLAHATPAYIFYCAGPGMARSRLSGAAGGPGLADAGADAVVVAPPRSRRCRDVRICPVASGCCSGVHTGTRLPVSEAAKAAPAAGGKKGGGGAGGKRAGGGGGGSAAAPAAASTAGGVASRLTAVSLGMASFTPSEGATRILAI